jgi:hypothetical protein
MASNDDVLEAKQNRGGRQSAAEWNHMKPSDNKKMVICKFCDSEVTKKIERVQNHLNKCANYKKINRQKVLVLSVIINR